MRILDLLDEDFVNYKKPSMTIMFPYCSFKCNKDAGKIVCQNFQCADQIPLDISNDELIERYIQNPISEAVVMQGLEPFDSFDEVFSFIYKFTEKCHDDIVIYTGYKEEEIEDQVKDLVNIIENNKLIIKYGRFVPKSNSRYDDVLGVELKSENQYAKVVKEPGRVARQKELAEQV